MSRKHYREDDPYSSRTVVAEDPEPEPEPPADDPPRPPQLPPDTEPEG